MKKPLFFLFVTIICFSTHSFSQSSNWLWAKASTANSYDYAGGICTDAAGNVYTTGFFQGSTITFGGFTLTSGGNADIFIVKYDAAGNVLWAKSGSGDQFDEGQSICADAAGNVYVTGFYQSSSLTFGSLTITNPNPGTLNFFIVKYNSSGSIQWAKTAKGGNGESVSADAANNIYVTGYFNTPTITFGSSTLTNPNNFNLGTLAAFLVKYDASGNLLWAETNGGIGSIVPISVSADATGNTCISGYFRDSSIVFGSFTLPTPTTGADNFFIVKYNSSGNVLWAKSSVGIGNSNSWGVSTDNNGNAYATGYFDSASINFGPFQLTNADPGTEDVFVVKYDAAGNEIWLKSISGSGPDRGDAISTDASGNIYVSGGFTGSTASFGTITETAPAGSIEPMFIAKYDPDGNILCTSVLSGGGEYSRINADKFGNAYIIGGFKPNPFIVGTDTLALTGTQNVFVAKYNCCVLPMVSAAASSDTICSGTSTQLSASGATGYSWNPATSLTCTSCANPTASPVSNVTYTVTGTINGCSNTDSITITAIPKPAAGIGSDITIVIGSSLQLTAAGGISYLWNTGENNAEITVAPETSTSYCVAVLDSNNCSDTVCILVTVKCGDYAVPNAFSPNNDGHNDLLVLHGWEYCISEFSLMIFNRWGEKVFESKDPNQSWNGKYKGIPLNPEVFVYSINATLTTGEKINRKGNVSLIR